MRKIASILIYGALLGFVITAIVNVIHLRDIATVIMMASCLALLAGCLISLVISGTTSSSMRVNESSRKSQIIRYTGVIVFITGVLLKKQHITGSEFIMMAGLVIILVFFITILYQLLTYKRYKAPGQPAIYILPSGLDQYTGVYTNPQLKMEITVTKNANDTSLEAQAKGQSAYPLNPIEPHIFSYAQWGIVMEFRPVQREFILIQKGGYYHFIKEERVVQ